MLYQECMVEPKNVDLKLAATYIPVCVAFFQLSIINIYVFFSPIDRLHSWSIVAMVLWCVKRCGKENIFEYNSLLQAIVFSSMMSNYRFELKDKGVIDTEWVMSIIWGVWFAFINLYLSFHNQLVDSGGVSNALLWLFYCLALISSFFSRMGDETRGIDGLKGFFFLVVSVFWVYMQNAHRLSHNRALSTDECILRFTALLMTTITVSSLLVVSLVLGITYAKKKQYTVFSTTKKKKEDTRLVKDPESGGLDDGINDIFRAAMAEKKAALNLSC